MAMLQEVGEEAVDKGRGLVGLLTLVNREERNLAQGYLMAWALGVSFRYLPPIVFISYWVILPQEQIPAVYLNILSELFSHWDRQSICASSSGTYWAHVVTSLITEATGRHADKHLKRWEFIGD